MKTIQPTPAGAFRALLAASIAATLWSPLTAAAAPRTLPEAALKTWRVALASAPLPGQGCFAASFPSTAWRATKCVTVPLIPQNLSRLPGRGLRPAVTGNGNDLTAQAPTNGLISHAAGTFPSATGILDEADQGNSQSFSLQLNTNTFFNSPACQGASKPSTCQGWEQFIYSNNGGITSNGAITGVVYIQYWLLGYNTACPSGWGSYKGSCFINSPSSAYPTQAPQFLSGQELQGIAGKSGETVIISGTGGEASAISNGSVLGLSKFWNAAEFNVFGDGNGTRADFNSGVKITVKTTIQHGTNAIPTCAAEGFTGETANLNLNAASCKVTGGTEPAIVFKESNPPGSIWQYTGTPCTGASCPGWQQLDNNNESVRIAATGSNLYQLWNNGDVWQYTGTPCTNGSCGGWNQIEAGIDTVEIVAGGNHLYQYAAATGSVLEQVGSSWELLDQNTNIVTLAAASGGLYELRNTGNIWQFTGGSCSGSACWQEIGDNSKTMMIATALSSLYQLRTDGTVWQYTGTPCSGSVCTGWQQLNNNPNALSITAAGSNLYELDNTGTIWKYTGTACSGGACTGWQMLDNNPAAMQLAADGNNLYELHNGGEIWKYTGTPCTGGTCAGWQMLDNNPEAGRIASSNGQLYELHVINTPQVGEQFFPVPPCYECR
jgi:hypothetical protein